MSNYSIAKATLGRLPKYLEYLKSLPEDKDATISANAIAKALSLGEVQVRKDLAAASGAGKPKIGYEREKLISDIERYLGYDGLTNAVLVGAGKLGKALLDYDGFEEFGVKIIAAFDKNEGIISEENAERPILSITKLKDFCSENRVKLGIITVGKESAQEVCDMLIDCGIEGVWNFAHCVLSVPAGILVKQENLALSLAHLSSMISK